MDLFALNFGNDTFSLHRNILRSFNWNSLRSMKHRAYNISSHRFRCSNETDFPLDVGSQQLNLIE